MGSRPPPSTAGYWREDRLRRLLTGNISAKFLWILYEQIATDTLKDLPTEEVWAKLLQPTLQNALRTEFYQSIWKSLDVSEIRTDSLHNLPVITKEQIRQAGRRAQV